MTPRCIYCGSRSWRHDVRRIYERGPKRQYVPIGWKCTNPECGKMFLDGQKADVSSQDESSEVIAAAREAGRARGGVLNPPAG